MPSVITCEEGNCEFRKNRLQVARFGGLQTHLAADVAGIQRGDVALLHIIVIIVIIFICIVSMCAMLLLLLLLLLAVTALIVHLGFTAAASSIPSTRSSVL